MYCLFIKKKKIADTKTVKNVKITYNMPPNEMQFNKMLDVIGPLPQ